MDRLILKLPIANIEIDNREKDVILMWQQEKGGDSNLLIVERERIKDLIKLLNKIVNQK